jgi:hypothetical protein
VSFVVIYKYSFWTTFYELINIDAFVIIHFSP